PQPTASHKCVVCYSTEQIKLELNTERPENYEYPFYFEERRKVGDVEKEFSKTK
ncbi:MAG: hypothetical protein RIQ47_1505, partial [Bacteroidota bacterium]